MQTYIDGALKIITSLALAGEPVPEHDLILNVLHGLPSEYASLKHNVRTNIAKLTFNEVSSWLLSEELNIQIEQKLNLRAPSGASTSILISHAFCFVTTRIFFSSFIAIFPCC